MCSFFSLQVTFTLILATYSRLSSVTPYPPGYDTQGNRIDRGKILRCIITPGDEIAIFFNISRQLIRGRISGAHLRHTSEDDDIASRPIPIKIEADPGVPLQMLQAFGI